MKLNLRRNKTRGAFSLVLLFISQSYVSALTETTSLSAVVEEKVITVSAQLEEVSPNEVLSSLQEGLKSEIIFQLRLYHKNRGFFSFFGDRLILEKTITRIAYLDIFEDLFVLETEELGIRKFRRKDHFLKSFFQLQDYRLAELSDENSSKFYVLARISLKPVRIVTPLNIISLFFRSTAITTPWAETALAKRQGPDF